MFEESLLESDHLLRTQNRWPAVAAFALQATIAATLLAIPIIHPEVVRLHTPRLEYTAPAPTPPRPPPPLPRQRVSAEAASSSVPIVPASETAAQPTRRSLVLDSNHFSETPPEPGASISMAGHGNSLDSTLTSIASVPTHVALAPASRAGPTRISLGVSAGLLLAPIQPIYPAIARAARQEGTVVIRAIISKDGRIESANAVSGPTMLQGAALEAVRSARYRPFRLNGEPTEVDTTFSIIFHLGS